jgi:hypothetical protein
MKEYYDSFKIMNTSTKSKVLIIIDLADLLLKKQICCLVLYLFYLTLIMLNFMEIEY